ncbi:type II toxin-antitoxin system VapC family toxin [Actinomycetota bacterium]
MIVDTSALIAVIEGEPGSDELLRLAAASPCRMSVASHLEAGIVADSRSTSHGARLDELLEALEIELVPVSVRDAAVARHAYRRFGRGSGSAAALDYGDCFAYALSVTSGEPLLFVGEDFTHTDVASARS